MKLFTPMIALLISSILISACEEKIESHTRPYMAEQQPRFYHNGQIQHLKSDNKPIHRIALIGDAGKSDIEPGKSTLNAFTTRLKSLQDTHETLVFLGDNIYQDGFQDDNTSCSNGSQESARLDAQLYLGKASRNISYFVPGNHDWDYLEDPDMKLMLKQKAYIETCGREAKLLPSDEQGMKLVSAISNNLFTMAFLDSHALMFAPKEKREQAYGLLEGIMQTAENNRPIILAAHHPIATYGPHGGCYQQDYFGHSIINFFRRKGISFGQDINAKEYAAYIDRINAIIPPEKKVLFVAGHDHNLQILQMEQGADYVIVSGAGSHTDPVCHGDNTLFAHESLGYVELGFRQGGELTAEVFAYYPDEDRLSKVYSQRLF